MPSTSQQVCSEWQCSGQITNESVYSADFNLVYLGNIQSTFGMKWFSTFLVII